MTIGSNVRIWIGSWDRKMENYRIKYIYLNKIYSLYSNIVPVLISQF